MATYAPIVAIRTERITRFVLYDWSSIVREEPARCKPDSVAFPDEGKSLDSLGLRGYFWAGRRRALVAQVLVKVAGGPHKLKFYAKLLCGLVLSPVGASFTTAQAQVNWRQTDSVNLGKTIARVEISSSRQIRITSVNDAAAELHSPDMSPVLLKTWAQSTHDELPTPMSLSPIAIE